MSSWALLNAGPEEQGYGWRFPGKEHDGAASGGFEPMYLGETWLQQPHHGGAWYYSCEIDLGFCGYLRGASTVWAKDPLFGEVCLGGRCARAGEALEIIPGDGVDRRVHLIENGRRIHITLSSGRILSVRYDRTSGDVEIKYDLGGSAVPSRICCEWVCDFGSESESRLRGEAGLSGNGVCTFSRQNASGKEGTLSPYIRKEQRI